MSYSYLLPLKYAIVMAEQDIRENAMSGGTPVRLRGLAANGNSISPTLEEVIIAMPEANDYSKGLMSAKNAMALDFLSFYYGVSGAETHYVRLGKSGRIFGHNYVFKVYTWNIFHRNYYRPNYRREKSLCRRAYRHCLCTIIQIKERSHYTNLFLGCIFCLV